MSEFEKKNKFLKLKEIKALNKEATDAQIKEAFRYYKEADKLKQKEINDAKLKAERLEQKRIAIRKKAQLELYRMNVKFTN